VSRARFIFDSSGEKLGFDLEALLIEELVRDENMRENSRSFIKEVGTFSRLEILTMRVACEPSHAWLAVSQMSISRSPRFLGDSHHAESLALSMRTRH